MAKKEIKALNNVAKELPVLTKKYSIFSGNHNLMISQMTGTAVKSVKGVRNLLILLLSQKPRTG